MKSEFADLSGDLFGEIFCRLDSKTLSNCWSVCKTWHQIISDPIFRRQFTLKNSKLVVGDLWEPDQTSTGTPAFSFTMHMDEGAFKRDILVTSRTLKKEEVSSDSIGRYGFTRLTCDMMLFYDAETANLLNPRTGELHILPGYLSPTCPDLHHLPYIYGYDASKAEYVLVASERVNEQRERVAKLCFTVGQTCSGWKIIWDAAFPHRTIPCLGILLNNQAYWPVCEGEGEEIIVSMDLDYSDSSDAFCIIKSPPPIPGMYTCFNDGDHVGLIDYKGSLGLVDTEHMAWKNTLLLWILEDRSSSLWMKKFHINLDTILSSALPDLVLVAVKSSKEGELIIHSLRGRSHYILNPETHKAQHLDIPLPHHPDVIAGSTPYHLWAAFM